MWKDAIAYRDIYPEMKTYIPKPIDLSDVELTEDLNDLREAIAENAHEIWALNRQSQGWTYGPERNDALKQTPDMVPYSQLPDSEKHYDREMAMNTIKLLEKLGYDLIKREDTELHQALKKRIRNSAQEYLSIRFRQDFLKFSLLQNDSLAAEEIADELLKEVDIKHLKNSGERRIKELLENYFSISKLKEGDRMTDTLPSSFEFGVQNKVADEFREYLDEETDCGIADKVLDEIVCKVEKQGWANGISNMENAVLLLQQGLDRLSLKLSAAIESESLPLVELKNAYEKARKRTLSEKINGGNYDDIVEYRSLLIDYVKRECQSILRAKMGRIYHLISGSPELTRLRRNFAEICKYADELGVGLPSIENVEAYEAEYNKLVPAEFYCRNVETITPEFAFQMVLLYFFARNEAWLAENGMLSEGRLKIFTGPAGGVRLLIDKLVASLF